MRAFIPFFFICVLFTTCKQPSNEQQKPLPETKAHLSPEIRYGDFFEAVQINAVFPESKTFVDCVPKFSTDDILQKYQQAQLRSDFDLKDFVNENFELPVDYSTNLQSDTLVPVEKYINKLWTVLTRNTDSDRGGTLVSLPKPYIANSGTSGELNYWESYFTILGLKAAKEWDVIENMVENFAFLIDTQGFISNGNRTYYLSHSHPPVFSLIIQLFAEAKGKNVLKKYLTQLQKEYDFWMRGLQQLSNANPAVNHVVRLQDGSILNRYWDEKDQPRPEFYKEDIAFVKNLDRSDTEVYRHLRAAVESGWGFSSRWFEDGHYMASLHTTQIIPVDLNALLYHLEKTLAEAYEIEGDIEESTLMNQRAENRKLAIFRYCWDEKKGFFQDYDFVGRKPKTSLSLAAMFPLFVGMAEQFQADSVASKITNDFLKEGGVLTTLAVTGQEWDAPFGWAPLQWIAIEGLRNYGHQALADSIKYRWIALNMKVFENTGFLFEKHNVLESVFEPNVEKSTDLEGAGWASGVLISLLKEDLTE